MIRRASPTRQPASRPNRTAPFLRLRSSLVATAFLFGVGAFMPDHVVAQEAFVVCDEQRNLEQVMASDGDFMPDGCRLMRLSTLDAEQGELCVMEFVESEDPGLVDRLTEAALPDTWWMRCADLGDSM